jgi:hypothetical protein
MAGKRSLEGHCVARKPKPAGRIILFFAWFAIGSVLFWGETISSARGDQGLLEVRIKDHREAIGDFSRVTLKVDKISISPNPGFKFWKSGWQDLTPSVETFDLTKYTGKQSVTVFKGMIAAGSFDAFHLTLKGVEGVLKKTQRSAKIKNSVGPIKFPFSIQPEVSTVIVIDLEVLDVSDHPPLSYELGIKGWELYTNGKLIDKIPPGP